MPTADDDYVTGPELAAVAGVHPAKVNRWTRQGIVRPVTGGGTGCPFLYPVSEVEVARILARWRAVVADPDTLARLATAARDQRGEDPRSIVAAVIADAVVITFGYEA